MTTNEKMIRDAAVKARDLIGNQSGDLTGAALDAWVILSDALRVTPPETGHMREIAS